MRRRKFNFYSAKMAKKYRYYVRFDGVSGGIETDLDPRLYLGPGVERTYECWALVREPKSNLFVMSHGVGSGQRLYVGAYTGKWGFGLATSSYSGPDKGIVDVEYGKWHHIALALGGGTGKLYLNGVLIQTKSYNPFTVTQAFVMSSNSTQNSYYLNGGLYEVRVWDKAMTQEEVTASMATATYTAPQPNLIGYYKLVGNSNDSSGNNHNGTPLPGTVFITEDL